MAFPRALMVRALLPTLPDRIQESHEILDQDVDYREK